MTKRIVPQPSDPKQAPVALEVILHDATPATPPSRFLACVFLFEPGIRGWHLHIVNGCHGPEVEGELYMGGQIRACPERWEALETVALEAYRAALAEAGEEGEVAA
jgi:hypothetical protein